MSDSSWRAVANLARVSGFETLLHELVGLPKRWREWAELARPEEVLLPGDWKRAGSLERLLVLRALRPDRLTQATELFVASTLGPKFAASQPWSLDDAYKVSLGVCRVPLGNGPWGDWGSPFHNKRLIRWVLVQCASV